jgi:hypothetical protein
MSSSSMDIKMKFESLSHTNENSSTDLIALKKSVSKHIFLLKKWSVQINKVNLPISY